MLGQGAVDGEHDQGDGQRGDECEAAGGGQEGEHVGTRLAGRAGGIAGAGAEGGKARGTVVGE